MTSQDNTSSNELPLLTFNSLYNLLREEKRSKSLQKLPEEFYLALNKFFEDKNAEIKKLQAGSESDKIFKEKNILKNSKKITRELLNIRCIKISNVAINNELEGEDILSSENILEYEQGFLTSVKGAVKKIKSKHI